MIPETYIESWRDQAKWQTLAMIEQDLIISRALVMLYNHSHIKDGLLFRGGTALNKLYLKPPARYSEDIDFVQRQAEPIGQTLNVIRDIFKDWLGEPKRKITERSAKLIYTYETAGGMPAKLKIEINTTEHIQVLPAHHEHFSMNSEWFQGECDISTYLLEELMATKMRALYQRRKGRDLFDLWLVFSRNLVDKDLVLDIFRKYCDFEGMVITKDLFLKNIELKRLRPDFQVDMAALLPHQMEWNFEEAFEYVKSNVIEGL